LKKFDEMAPAIFQSSEPYGRETEKSSKKAFERKSKNPSRNAADDPGKWWTPAREPVLAFGQEQRRPSQAAFSQINTHRTR
jgi:hypothetical protein